jgi:hypothetical protein
MESRAIHDLIHQLSAGDTLEFGPGAYKGPFTLTDVNGMLNQPIVIQGNSEDPESVIIDGGSEPGVELSNNAFQLKDSGCSIAGPILLFQKTCLISLLIIAL